MSLTVVSSNSIGPGTRLNPAAGSSGLILEGVSVIATDTAHAVVMDDRRDMTIHGTVASGGVGVYTRNATTGSGENSVHISATGNVSGYSEGVLLRDAGVSLDNAGEIYSADIGVRVGSSGRHTDIMNSGRIS